MEKFILEKLPPKQNFNTINILKQLALASRTLAELKGYSDTIPNKNILINAITINEAKDSSAIENIVTTHDDIYQKMIKNNYNNSAAKEVINYRTAILYGYKLIKQNHIFTTNMIIEIQSIIEENEAGVRKTAGTVLKDELTGEIIYTPPSGKDVLRDYLDNLEAYINDDSIQDVDPLIKLAIIHYQFENIHPFYDGNGRAGRIINILYIVLKELLDSPILYLSNYIINNKSNYYRHFREIKTTGNWEEYIIFMLAGIEQTAKETLKIIKNINALIEDTTNKIKERLPKIYSKELVELLFYEFYTKITFLVEGLNINRKTASKYLHQLEEIGILESEKVGSEIFYKNIKLFELPIK